MIMKTITITKTIYLVRYNQTRNIKKISKISIIQTCKCITLQRSCQGDCTENIMIASIQPPIMLCICMLNRKCQLFVSRPSLMLHDM